MGLRDWFRGGTTASSAIGLAEVLSNYDLVDVDRDNGVVVVSERGGIALANGDTEARPATAQELGGASTSYMQIFREEYHPDLRGDRALKKYREMRNDSIVRSTLRIAKTPVLAARWFVEPASNDPQSREIAEFIYTNLTQWMTQSWPQFLTEILYMMDYGYYVFEKVFDIRPDGKIYWRKFAPRHPYEVQHIEYDEKGGPKSFRFIAEDASEGFVDVDISKLLVFTFDKEGGDLTGTSILRSAYKHWFYKENLYKIDAIQKERHGIGIPIIKLPVNFSPNDKLIAQRIGANLRTNESAHVVLPPGWEVFFAKLEGQKIDALVSAQHHADKLYENVLATFMSGGSATEMQMQENMFHKGSRFIAEIARDVLNKYAIPQLVDWNWEVDAYPELRVRRLGDTTDWRTISFAMRNFAGMGALTSDDRLEHWIREEMDLPQHDPETARELPTPQGGARPGLPKQSRTPQVDVGNNGRRGRDASGVGT